MTKIMLHLNKSLYLVDLSFQENKEMHLKPIKIETSALQFFTNCFSACYLRTLLIGELWNNCGNSMSIWNVELPMKLTHALVSLCSARIFYDWIIGKNRPDSGSLIEVVTTGGKSELSPAHL